MPDSQVTSQLRQMLRSAHAYSPGSPPLSSTVFGKMRGNALLYLDCKLHPYREQGHPLSSMRNDLKYTLRARVSQKVLRQDLQKIVKSKVILKTIL